MLEGEVRGGEEGVGRERDNHFSKLSLAWVSSHCGLQGMVLTHTIGSIFTAIPGRQITGGLWLYMYTCTYISHNYYNCTELMSIHYMHCTTMQCMACMLSN